LTSVPSNVQTSTEENFDSPQNDEVPNRVSPPVIVKAEILASTCESPDRNESPAEQELSSDAVMSSCSPKSTERNNYSQSLVPRMVFEYQATPWQSNCSGFASKMKNNRVDIEDRLSNDSSFSVHQSLPPVIGHQKRSLICEATPSACYYLSYFLDKRQLLPLEVPC